MDRRDQPAPRWADCYRALIASKTDDVAGLRAVLAAAPQGPVLELGAGFGRLAVVAAEMGRQVVAVEVSDLMLDYREVYLKDVPGEVLERITWRAADAREVGEWHQDSGRYALVVCAYNGLNEILDGLRQMIDGGARVLAPGGLLYLDWHSASYDRADVVEFCDYLQVSGERWAVFTVVRELGDQRHDLTLIYERIDGDAVAERLYQVLERRSWPRDEVEAIVAPAFDRHPELTRGNVMVVVKKADQLLDMPVDKVSIDGTHGAR